MINNLNVLSIIPARSGSKGLKDKNIKFLNGIELLGWAGLASAKSKYIDKTIVSTDSRIYQDIAKKYFIDTPFDRPDELSSDYISDHQVLYHSLIESEKIFNKKFDIILMLQPTSPFRNELLIDQCIEKLIQGGYDSLWTISKISKKFHPFKQLYLSKDNKLKYHYINGKDIVSRQQLSDTYIRNGQCYCFSRNLILKENSILSKNSGFIITPNYPNIDDEKDFIAAEKLFEKYNEK